MIPAKIFPHRLQTTRLIHQSNPPPKKGGLKLTEPTSPLIINPYSISARHQRKTNIFQRSVSLGFALPL